MAERGVARPRTFCQQLHLCSACRVELMQQALVTFTGVAVQDQIVMVNGTKLDPAKELGAYQLPVVRRCS